MSIGVYVNRDTGERFDLVAVGCDFNSGVHTCIFMSPDGFHFTLPAIDFFDGRFAPNSVSNAPKQTKIADMLGTPRKKKPKPEDYDYEELE